MFFNSKKQGRIFISYRRSDTQGYAGRLSDSLGDYFGENRVFRDIEDIKGGSEYAKDIESQVSTADAVIVLIGPQWLTTADSDGNRRIDNPNDWVAQEIVMAMEHGIRIFPVLIEGTVLPRAEELPEKLAPILNYNAITISDSKWDADILALGKIISFDIPTTNERILFWVQALIYSLLSISLIISAATVAKSAINIPSDYDPEVYKLIARPIAAIPFYVIISALIILSLILRLIAKEKQKYIIYSIVTGVVGSAFFFFGFVFIREQSTIMEQSMFIFFGSVLVSTLMLLFLGLSGFKPK
ncbi:toll/interleukin-1 receptor domain-containing protein [Lacinutrix iliipiscaria]|uniref:Toll/interleukin-1 receptor domain-containing protein n=1 Tax=Lacinutrix iliipiscaria TaxID=1230532 RepID=A0ABW5WJI0_9FLAO